MLRFTIRDVLWLTAVVALALGWWLQFQKAEAAHRIADRAQREVKAIQLTARDEEARHDQEMDQFRTFTELLSAKLKEKGFLPRFRKVTRNGTTQIVLLEEDGRPPAD